MQKISQILRYLIILLSPAYFLALGNSISNRHTHILSNGMVISHAHPFKKGDIPGKTNHDHTQTQYFFYQSLSDLSHTLESAKENITVFQPYTKTEYNTQIPQYVSESIYSFQERSPPIC